MPSFKQKPQKKIKVNKKSLSTLDTKHRDIINKFAKQESENIPKLKQERDNIINILQTDKSLTIEQQMNYKDRLAEISSILKNLKKNKKDYLLDNSKYVFDYFENKKNISDGNEIVKTNNNKLNAFFKIKDDSNKREEKTNDNIFQKYLSNIDDSYLDINTYVVASDICPTCHVGELIPVVDEGILMCNECYKNVPYLVENDKPSYKEPPKEVCFYAYKKINHFKEILAQFQGKETTQIPIEVTEGLKNQIKKERISYDDLTYYKLKDLLKKLGYNKYYEHINFIKDKLGMIPPTFSQELEEILCNFFMEIQYPYAKHCPDYRVNFLHYYYVLFKLLELLEEYEYLSEIPMLKDREKLLEQDNIWKKICQDLDWQFIDTINV